MIWLPKPKSDNLSGTADVRCGRYLFSRGDAPPLSRPGKARSMIYLTVRSANIRLPLRGGGDLHTRIENRGLGSETETGKGPG